MSKLNLKFYGSLFLIACIVCTFSSVGFAQSRRKQKNSKAKSVDYSAAVSNLKRSVPEMMAKQKALGVAVALVDGDRPVWAEGFGFTDAGRKTPVTADTLFSTQSISKCYTATAFIKAMQNGWFKIDDRLKSQLPDFTVRSRYGNDEADKMTFRHLLGHWAGFPHEAPLGGGHDDRSFAFDQHVKSIWNVWLKAPVGERFSYSNLGIDLTGYVLQQRSGKPFDQFMKNELLLPLGMRSSTFNRKEAFANPSLAKGYIGDQQIPDIVISMIPSGGLYSNVKDMAKFVSMHLSGGKINGKNFIRRDFLQEMYRLQFPVKYQVAGYGLGMEIKPAYGATLFGHGGSGYGYSTEQRWIPEYGLGVVVLTNAGDTHLAGKIADTAFRLMLTAKYGAVPKDKIFKLTDQPIVEPKAEALQRLEGTYRTYNNVVTFKVADGHLHYIRGDSDLKLDAHSPTEFTGGGEKFTFHLDETGAPKFVHNLGANFVDVFLLNDQPNDPPGPNRPEWSEYVGQYQGPAFGIKYTTKIYLKNGYLYSSRGNGTKLTEYQPGLFFTADGEAVIFENGRMSLGNRPVVKVP